MSQGISAELIAGKWGLSRVALDEYALESHRRAVAAIAAGLLDRQLLPVTRPDGTVVRSDEGSRADTTAERLAGLAPAFVDEAMATRFPEIEWSVTAGNSSPTTDGASAIVVMNRELADCLGLRPRAIVRNFSVIGDDPILMLTGVIPVTRRLLDRANLSVADIDVWEVNEAFASVVLAWQAELGASLDQVNAWGGAIAFGHPVGASGGRVLAKLLDVLDQRDGRFGVLTMCESGGMANATLLERVG